MNIVLLRLPLYEAKIFRAVTEDGEYLASGTLCGHIDFVGPWKGTYLLSPDEALSIITMLQQARADVLNNSDPFHDPRIVEPQHKM